MANNTQLQTMNEKLKTTAVAKPQSYNDVLKVEMKKIYPSIQKIIPKHLTAERLLRLVLTVTSRTPELANCTPQSIIGAVVNCSILGLEPNLLGHAYLVPYNNRKTGQKECEFQIGYKGYLELVMRKEKVTIYAHTVYENEDFIYTYGFNKTLEHTPKLTQRGKPVAYYAVYKDKDGRGDFIVMSAEDMAEHKRKHVKSKYGPWQDHYDAMAHKTVIKQLTKLMPLSIENQKLLATDGKTIAIDENPNGMESDEVMQLEYVGEFENEDGSDTNGATK